LLVLDRRFLLAGFGAAAFASVPGALWAQTARTVLLSGGAGTLGLMPGRPNTPVRWIRGPDSTLRARQDETLEVSFQNDLPVPAFLLWRGLDGAAAAEPLVARKPTAPGARESLTLPLRDAGTLVCELRPLDDGTGPPSRPLPVVVEEQELIPADREEMLLIEDWRVRPDGGAIPPGHETEGTLVYTVNGRSSPVINGRPHERLRFRIINACQRSMIALKFEGLEVRPIALDSKPAEPFLARNSTLGLAPGARIDALVDLPLAPGASFPIFLHDGTEPRSIVQLFISTEPPMRASPMPPPAPLPGARLPMQLNLRNALRFDLPLGGALADWVPATAFTGPAAPAFRAKRGQTLVLTLSNRASKPSVFHLHGHHFRLLDRLDDGWKPFWLDTLAVGPGQTDRIAFLAEHAGRWLIEQVGTDWSAPRVVRWYNIE
jgi:FtsP/CotA-like multicopper oxidase with cupredoxin domain